MADLPDGPLARLVRLAGGVMLQQGGLGHQILGQLLVVGATDIEVAGATAALAATAGQRNALAQVAVRSVAPALAARSLIRRSERRILQAARTARARERAADEAAVLLATEVARRAWLETENERLRRRVEELTAGPVAPAPP